MLDYLYQVQFSFGITVNCQVTLLTISMASICFTVNSIFQEYFSILLRCTITFLFYKVPEMLVFNISSSNLCSKYGMLSKNAALRNFFMICDKKQKEKEKRKRKQKSDPIKLKATNDPRRVRLRLSYFLVSKSLVYHLSH